MCVYFKCNITKTNKLLLLVYDEYTICYSSIPTLYIRRENYIVSLFTVYLNKNLLQLLCN